MKLLRRLLAKIFLNWKRPRYSKYLFEFCSRYVNFCYGDNNFDRLTNGEYWLLAKIIPHAKVVFDVGANNGEYSKSILDLNHKVFLHAFEPDGRAFEHLKKNTQLEATINNCALGEKEGVVTLYRRKDKTVFNSLYNLDSSDEPEMPIRVPMQTLDAYCSKKNIGAIDFLKIDVEGYEFFVIQGAENMLKNGTIDFIQFEFSGATVESRKFLKDFIDLFEKYSYTLYRIKPISIEKVVYYPDQERFTLTNYLAIRDAVKIDHIPQTKAFYH